MKNCNNITRDTFASVIVQGALIAVFGTLMTAASLSVIKVSAQELEEEGEKLPPLYTNQIEFGALYNSEDSSKFGEYTGLDEEGVKALGNLSILGSDGTLRWNLLGNDLGTTSRSINGLLSVPGKWELSAGYDGLRHNISDTYQTPQLGIMGGNNFTLPENFGSVNGNHSGTDAPYDANSTRSLTVNQLSDFHNEKIHSDRDKTSFGAEYRFTDNLSAKLSYNHLQQSGAKLISTGAQGGISLLGGNSARSEAVNILMNPTEYTTDTVTATFEYQGERGYLSLGYFGSLFDDRYNSLSWQTAQRNSVNPCVGGQACYANNTMSTAPDNVFHQFNMAGGYVFSPMTRLAGGFSYGVNTQNDDYAPTLLPQANGVPFDMMQPGGLPQFSLDGEVHNLHGDAKLTHQASRDLTVSAAFNYNERDNRTQSNIYEYVIIGNSDYTGVNLPYSYRNLQARAAADYRLSNTQKLHLGYEHEFVKRWCDDVPGGLECVSTPKNDEDKVELTYRARASDTVNFNAGYTYIDRGADFADSFAASDGEYPELNAGDKLGWRTHIFDARTQHKVKAGINWQATDNLDFGVKGSYADNNYDAELGFQGGNTSSVNLDATYAYAEKGSIAAYGSWQNSKRDLRSGNNGSPTVAPTNIWTNQLKQDSYAIGMNIRQSGLKDGKLELMGDVSYSYDNSYYSTQVPYNTSCDALTSLICGDTPDITASLFRIKLSGTYQLNEKGKVALGYMYQKLDNNDYYYNIYQYGYTPDRVIPTNERAFNYGEHLVGVSYIYQF